MRISIFLVLGVLLCPGIGAQQFEASTKNASTWQCHGWVAVENAHLYCDDVDTHEIAKYLATGQQVFPRLEAPPAGDERRIIGLAEDVQGKLYGVDGVHIFVYSPDGKYESSFSPGISMSGGIVVLDAKHIFVSGHVAPGKGDSTANVFLIGSGGVERSFSDVFVRGLTGVDDYVMNSPSMFALDRVRKLLYQVSPFVYEIRVFDLDGKQVNTIRPPENYNFPSPQLRHYGKGAAPAPGDVIADMAVLPGGGLLVKGDLLDHAETQGKNITSSYSRFVDFYDSKGNFQHRLMGDDLKLEDTYYWGVDHMTGKIYFKGDTEVIETEAR